VQLTGFTDLALRIVMRLAVLDEERATTTSELADELNVSTAHAAKVVTVLGGLGVVDARRGRRGGLRLAEGAAALSVGALVRRLEGGPGYAEGQGREVVQCEGAHPCPLRAGCRLRAALRDAQEAFFAALDPLTIADVTAAPTRSLLLSLGPTRT
jgi:Rrf2 family nitric oxide-sensitive transcriptional repressor